MFSAEDALTMVGATAPRTTLAVSISPSWVESQVAGTVYDRTLQRPPVAEFEEFGTGTVRGLIQKKVSQDLILFDMRGSRSAKKLLQGQKPFPIFPFSRTLAP